MVWGQFLWVTGIRFWVLVFVFRGSNELYHSLLVTTSKEHQEHRSYRWKSTKSPNRVGTRALFTLIKNVNDFP